MTVFEMEVFYLYTLFTHIGLYVQEMSIFFFFLLSGSSSACFQAGLAHRQSQIIYTGEPPCQGVQMGDFYSGERWQICC
jgi:hypothetical protein